MVCRRRPRLPLLILTQRKRSDPAVQTAPAEVDQPTVDELASPHWPAANPQERKQQLIHRYTATAAALEEERRLNAALRHAEQVVWLTAAARARGLGLHGHVMLAAVQHLPAGGPCIEPVGSLWAGAL